MSHASHVPEKDVPEYRQAANTAYFNYTHVPVSSKPDVADAIFWIWRDSIPGDTEENLDELDRLFLAIPCGGQFLFRVHVNSILGHVWYDHTKQMWMTTGVRKDGWPFPAHLREAFYVSHV